MTAKPSTSKLTGKDTSDPVAEPQPSLHGPLAMTINGHVHVFDRDAELAVPPGCEAFARSTAASRMAFWGAVWAAARRQNFMAQAHYKRWRDAMLTSVSSQSDPKTGKPYSEWRAQAAVRAHPDYMVAKTNVGQAGEVEDVAYAVYESFRALTRMLSYGAGVPGGADVSYSLEGMSGSDPEVQRETQRVALEATRSQRAHIYGDAPGTTVG